ncbi:hypothetical protein ACFW2T_33250 [Streptomyces sp. NPDC058892]|uniref:hypothetical protein n=2 Tax=Actinomycetota TaxID=201174 RepID=UPI0036665C0C
MSAMKPLTIKLPDHFLSVAREIAEAEDTSLSAWCAKAVTDAVLRRAAEAEADWAREHPEETATIRDDADAEAEARWADEHGGATTTHHRHGDAA